MSANTSLKSGRDNKEENFFFCNIIVLSRERFFFVEKQRERKIVSLRERTSEQKNT